MKYKEYFVLNEIDLIKLNRWMGYLEINVWNWIYSITSSLIVFITFLLGT